MTLTSPLFLFLFLPAFMLAYHVGSARLKLLIGIVGSLLFYALDDLGHVPLVFALVLGTYALALGMDVWRGRPISRALLWFGIAVNIGLLIAYKHLPGTRYPLGLSYLTFQAVAHLIDVYRQPLAGDRSLLRFSFYLLLFPKLPAGPIARYSQLRTQVADLHPQPLHIADGLRRFIRGLAKKVLLADTLGRLVDPIFALASPAVPPSWAWLILVSYALQLYFDFSGYADMAIGLGRMLGVTFPENFNSPYMARSLADFWRRWHISLSNWFRDYVFYPLERRRLRWIGQPLNFLIVFLLVGLWHGQTANFIVWGLIHGVALAFESTPLGRKFTALPAIVGRTYALSIILLGWTFFRSPTLGFALGFLRRLVGDSSGVKVLAFDLTSPLPFIEPTILMALAAGLLLVTPIGRWLETVLHASLVDRPRFQVALRLGYDLGLLALLFASIAAAASSTFAPGIYARF